MSIKYLTQNPYRYDTMQHNRGGVQMAYRYGDRCQYGLFPQSIEDYVAPSDPVRAYDAFVEALDFNALGIEIDPNQVGNSEYDPKAMLKLYVYGYSYGIKTSRKLERERHHNLSFIWLMGGLKPVLARGKVFFGGRTQDPSQCCTGPDTRSSLL